MPSLFATANIVANSSLTGSAKLNLGVSAAISATSHAMPLARSAAIDATSSMTASALARLHVSAAITAGSSISAIATHGLFAEAFMAVFQSAAAAIVAGSSMTASGHTNLLAIVASSKFTVNGAQHIQATAHIHAGSSFVAAAASPFNILGYVLEPPRVGQSNSKYTMTPNDVESEPFVYDVFFPQGSEPNPRVDYLTLVMTDGLLPDATFGWTKNEVIARFDYSGPDQRFKNLPGGPIATLGQIGPTINTSGSRLNVVAVPVVIPSPAAPAPFRVSVGATGAGATFPATLVTTFSTPPVGHVQILLEDKGGDKAGDLNWNPADLVTFSTEAVRFQQQPFFSFSASNGNIGSASGTLVLNPMPDGSQYPLLRIGYGPWLTPAAVVTINPLSLPPTGTFNWQIGTGLVQLSAVEAGSHKPVYYDGVLIAGGLMLPSQPFGTVTSPAVLNPAPIIGGDLIFRLDGVAGKPEFPYINYVTSFGYGQPGTVQILLPGIPSAPVQFSVPDQIAYGSALVTYISGDLPIERGISLRLFRTPLNLNGTPVILGGQKDVTSLYAVQNATYANPIIGSPQIFLPSVPRDDGTLVVSIVQGTGTFAPGVLPILDGTQPLPSGRGPTYGYVINYDSRLFQWAFRKNNLTVPLLAPSGAIMLPDPLIQPGALSLLLETGANTDQYVPLTIGTDVLLDATSGQVTFIDTIGLQEAAGSGGTFTGNVLTDPADLFASVLPGDFLAVLTGNAWNAPTPGDSGVYTVATVPSISEVTTDLPAPITSPVGYEIFRNKEVLADRYFEQLNLVDPNTKVESIIAIGKIANATTIVPGGTATSFNTTTLTDPSTNFTTAGVQPGDTIEVTSGPDSGSFRRVQQVQTHTLTVLGSYPFVSFASATYTVIRRLNIQVSTVNATRFRFGPATFASPMVVANDGAFSVPPVGFVQISSKTGNLNFNPVDVGTGATVYAVKTLVFTVDYQMNPMLGLISLTQRMLQNEELLITYIGTNPTSNALEPVIEPAVFLVRKELTQPHPIPTNVLKFNPLGRPVASTPAPSVWRGGRPQAIPRLCVVNTQNSTITFQPDPQKQTALPSGIPIGPTENVYIDYYVTQAIGGEQTITIQEPPMSTAQILINEGSPTLLVSGNQVAFFPAGFLLNVANDEIHLIGSSAFDPATNMTTVTLTLGDLFLNSYQNPTLYITSGQTRLTSSLFFPSYFPIELSPYQTVPRGMNTITISGDRTSSYHVSTVILFTDGATYYNFYSVTQAALNANGDTVLTLNSNTLQQYTYGPHGPTLQYSVRPILPNGATQVQTSLNPVLSQPYLVFRRVEGQIGTILTPTVDYSIDSSGTVMFKPPLTPNEEISIFYTGHVIQPAGINLEASYTALTVPTQANGLLNQVLQANYNLFSPDTFYFRVETLTNFEAEVAMTLQAQAQASIPTSGPVTSNSGGGPLYTQGRPSLYFDEEHDGNEDYVARLVLKFYNDIVNTLEDALQAMDGRVVGDQSGRFLFDGVVDRTISGFPPNLAAVRNQIDDTIQVSPFPIFSTFPQLANPQGTYQPIYQTGPYSRFFRNRRNIFGTSPCLQGSNGGDQVEQMTFANLTSLPGVCFKRWPRAQIQQPAAAGQNEFIVDNANASNDALQRPGFITQMRVVIEDAAGNVYIPASANVTVTRVSQPLPAQQTLVLSAGASMAVPAGATIYLSPNDANSSLSQGDYPPGPGNDGAYAMQYRFGKDVNMDQNAGELLYLPRQFPNNGIISHLPPPFNIIPVSFDTYPVQQGDIIEVDGVGVAVTNTAPTRVPALDGLPYDDDGNQVVPMVGPLFTGELTPAGGGALNDELTALTQGLVSYTTFPFVSQGTLTSLSTIQLVPPSNTFPTPTPKQYDLVRIVTGLNGPSTWRHINTFTANSVTVLEPFTHLDSNFTFEVAVSGTLIAGTCTLSGTNLNDPSTFFTEMVVPTTPPYAAMDGDSTLSAIAYVITPDSPPHLLRGTADMYGESTMTATATLSTPTPVAGIGIGWTVVIRNGSNASFRRQVVAVPDSHDITLNAPFPNNGSFTYRIDNPLNTYTGPVIGEIETDGLSELGSVSREASAILTFFNQIFLNPVVASGTGSVGAGMMTLSDSTPDFIAKGVSTNDFVWITGGPNQGVYQIASITSAHVLDTQQAFPASSSSLLYVIVPAFGCTYPTMQALYGILTTNEAFQTATIGWITILVTFGTVAGDPGASSNYLLPTDVSNRIAVVSGRIAYLNDPSLGPIATIHNALAGTEKLYDKRYAWINGRLNLLNGFLASEALAITNRIAAQANIVQQLLMLLAVQGGG